MSCLVDALARKIVQLQVILMENNSCHDALLQKKQAGFGGRGRVDLNGLISEGSDAVFADHYDVIGAGTFLWITGIKLPQSGLLYEAG